MHLPTLNLIGPGRLGRTLAHCWQRAGHLHIAGVVGRNTTRTEAAVAFIGAGRPVTLATLTDADFTLIATPDDQLASVAGQLAQQGKDWHGKVAFHCSGAAPSDLLAPLREAGALIASVHPLKSFADPVVAVDSMAGTWCGCEGDPKALARLAPLFDALSARRFAIDAGQKTLYHAAAVLACNNLVALMEAALRSMAAAGVAADTAWPALRPLVEGTLANLDRFSTSQALTGPVARGDAATIERQQAATTALDPAVGEVYRALGIVALQLARLDAPRHAAVARALGDDSQ
jgi:predicted short-subunit dehydrogenase-like oxidoreductase (DUF2520 family)